MRFLRRLCLPFLLVTAIALIFLPPVIGIGVQQLVYKGAFVFNLQNKNDWRVLEYRRGWFSSDITSSMKVTDPSINRLINILDIPDDEIPKSIEVIFKQHIQHGPVFYFFSNALGLFGLANIDRKYFFPSNQKRFFAHLGMTDSMAQKDQMLLSFTGKIFSHTELVGFRIWIPKKDFILQFGSAISDIGYRLFSQRVEGNVAIEHFYLKSDDKILSLPTISAQFDLQKDPQGLWIGSQAITLPAMILNDLHNEYQINDMRFSGSVDEKLGLLTGEKSVTFEKMQFEDQSIGPFHFQVNAEQIDASSIANLINTYVEIAEQGELYESQLRQRLLAVLPHIVTPGASIELSQFQFATPYGQFMLKAKLEWPSKDFIAPDSMSDLVKSSRFNASLQVATPLVDQVIKMIAKFSYIRQLQPQDREELLLMRKDMRLAARQNSAAIFDLVQTNKLDQEDSTQLLKMARENVSLGDYSLEVQKLLFTRKITLETSYLLNWLFASLEEKNNLYKQNLSHYEDAAEKLFHTELDEYIKAGLIVKDKNDYVSLIQFENGVMKVNGKKLR